MAGDFGPGNRRDDPWRAEPPLDEGRTPLAPDEELAALEQEGLPWWERRPWPRVVVWAKRAGLALVALAMLVPLTIALVIHHYEKGLPAIAELKNYSPPQVTRIVARDGTLLGELFTERRTVVPIDAIPNQMKLAALAAEDANFYEHSGLNYLGMLRALVVNLRHAGARQGGSTITQQVVKNVLLSPERTFDRKMREVILARRIEQELTKDDILELYLNHIYFGHGRYGVEEAARYYFGKSIKDVTLAEAALLAAVVKGPAHYSPRVDIERAAARRAFVLEQMQAKGFATPEQVAAAEREPITLAPETEALAELAPEVVAEVQRTLRSLVGPAADRGGYTITTTIDPALQNAARTAVRKNLDDYAKRHKLFAPLVRAKKEPAAFEGVPKAAGHPVFLGVVTGADDAKDTLAIKVGTAQGTALVREAARYNPKNVPPTQFAEVGKVVRVSFLDDLPATPAAPADTANVPATSSAAPGAPEPNDAHVPASPRLRLELGPQSALVAIDVRSREIVAFVGGYDAVRGGLDRASFAKRQPGSTFKAFVYGYAIHSRTMTPATIVETNPKNMKGYRPDNFDESEGKTPKRLRDALAQSVNVAAVWTMQRIGPANVAAFAHALGIESKLGADLSLALGAYEVTPREMAGAYAALAAGGVFEPPVLITKIVGPNGADVPLPPRAPPRRVIDEAEAYMMTSLLQSVVDSGTGKRAKILGRPIAGKTGTSNQARDAWFVGYSTEIACAVWTGFDDNVPLGSGEMGATAALPAFVDFMKEAHKKRPVTDFPVPAGLVHASIDPETGLRAGPNQADAIDEIFLQGTEPNDVAADVDGGADAADAAPPNAPSAAQGSAPAAPAPATAGPNAPAAVPRQNTADPLGGTPAPPPF